MINLLIMRVTQIYEFIRSNGWLPFLREIIYINRKAILAEKNLREVNDSRNFLQRSNIRFLEITPGTFDGNNYQYHIKNRKLKALHYLRKGYGGYAIARGNNILGDVWYVASNKSGHVPDHPDIHWLGIKWAKDYVYCFDIFIVPDERGNNLAAPFQNSAMYSLRNKGYLKAYAYYWADNIPAVWITRVINKWKELKTLRVNRFLFFKNIRESEIKSIYT